MTVKRGKFKKESVIKSGRPRVLVDFAIVLRLRDVDNMGWSRMAETYRGITGQDISRDTIKRRYLEAKALRKPLEESGRLSRIYGNKKSVLERTLRRKNEGGARAAEE